MEFHSGYEGYCELCGSVIKTNIQGNELGNHKCNFKIAVLCAHKKSHYYQIPGLDIYNQERDAYTFNGKYPGIYHPPCAQWSKLKGFANKNLEEKQLAYFCLDKFKKNGGIYEHPKSSAVWTELDWPDETKFISVDQSWWGFPARKSTILAFYKCEPLSFPLNFDAIQFTVCLSRPNPTLPEMKKSERALTPLAFDQWLVDCIRKTFVNS